MVRELGRRGMRLALGDARYPEGLVVWVCRGCQRVGLDHPRCDACGKPSVTAVIFNLPPEDCDRERRS